MEKEGQSATEMNRRILIVDDESDVNLALKIDVNFEKQICFLICKSCFWCASYFTIVGDIIISKCQACNSDRVESMPIADNEIYKFDYDPKRGVTLEFSRSDGVDRIRG